MSDENVALVHRWFEEVWNQGRPEAIDEMLAPDSIAYGLGEAGVDVTGPAAFNAFVEKMRGAFPEFKITVEDTVAAGDKVATRWIAQVTHHRVISSASPRQAGGRRSRGCLWSASAMGRSWRAGTTGTSSV